MSTLTQLWGAVSNRVGNLDSAVAADQSRMTTWANEAVVQVLRRTRCRVVSATVSLAASVSDYTLDTTILAVTSAYTTSSGTSRQVELVTVDELLGLRSQNASSSSPVTHMALAGADLLLVYPTPSAADTLTVYYVPRPTAMSASGNDPSNATYGGIPVEWHKAIELYMCAEAADDDDDQSSAQGQRYRDSYEQWIRRIRNEARTKWGPYNPRAVVNAHRRSRGFHDNSTDRRA